MTVRANMFTPQVLLSVPRRSPGSPNASGTKVLYTTSTYSFESHRKTAELRCLDVKSKESKLLTDDDSVSDPVWLEDGTTLACLKSLKDGCTELLIASTEPSWECHVAGKIEAPASSLKIAHLSDTSYAVVVAAQAYPDGSLYNPEKELKTQSTGKLYNSLYVRHWDAYIGKEKNTLLYGTLKQGKEGKYELSSLVNALRGTGLESPIPPFGGADSFDVSKRYVANVRLPTSGS